jgi:hypothetical protein
VRAVRTEAQNAKFLQSKRDTERTGFFFYRSINRMHSAMKGNIVKSWIENDGMVEKMGVGENFSASFCKARLDDLCR